MKSFLKPLEQLGCFEEVNETLKKKSGIVQLSGCMDSQKMHMAYGLGQPFSHRLILTYSELKAKELYEDYRFFDKNVVLYQAKDFLFFQADIQSNLLLKQRIQGLKSLIEQKEVTVITTIDGCMDRLTSLDKIKEKILRIDMESIIELDALKMKLVQMGYERTGQVEYPGQFAVRGGIIDIFSLTEEVPWRIELWDEEVDSIRSFDIESQRSIENLDNIELYPAKEFPKEDGISFLDYFPKEDTLILLDEPNRIAERGRAVETEYRESVMERAEKDFLYTCETIMEKISLSKGVAFSTIETKLWDWKISGRYQVDVRSMNSYKNSFELLVKDLKRWKKEKFSAILLCASSTRGRRLAEDLQEEGISSYFSEDPDKEVLGGTLMILHGNVHKGYEYPMIKFVVLSESDIFGKEKKKKKRKKYEGKRIQSFSELSIGDYVVHENHGLGIYKGIEKVEVEKVLKDYIKIEYAKGGNLYILATQLEMIQKYGSADGRKPKLNAIGGKEWVKTKAKVRGAVQDIAMDLVSLYASRQEKKGFVYGEDTVWQTEFEELFPFDETEDQQLAIEATKQDMESTKIMDRLVCGDVGYGKTEIAIRAAFKAVQEGKQVVYLVPTTILAQQHYNTFVQRMKDFPVRIDLMCRFRTPAQQKKTLVDLKKGLVDIVVGTHRILSADVDYKDLGLLIVDEEQRFGVAHKEKIKKLKENVDVLTLTATPIPRTLHMSLIGIRDMSVLEEAPQERVPIQTYVMEYDEEMVRAAIYRELAREGQIYYVYNRVNNIADIAGQIAKLVPEATVVFAHGQMKERELEQIMYDFIEGSIDVLVSTTIIETGLDISNANTMIIHDADNMGLSQLYQLRGRVGRSNRTAYAFLLYRKDKMLKEIAEKRLGAIKEFTELGSGFKIAMRDLEIRGAGNLLGAQQHGHMEAVGYDLYCKMLNEAVKEQKGEPVEEEFLTTIEFDLDAYIPETYIPSESQKLTIYKRIATLESDEECEDMLEELMDRFGEAPKAVLNLLKVVSIKIAAHKVYVKEIKEQADEIKFGLYERARINPAALPGFIESFGGQLRFVRGENPCFLYRKIKSSKSTETSMDAIEMVLEKMKELTEEIG